jgi:hypothetical protein
MVNPLDNPELYDVIELGNVRSPGVVRSISGHDRTHGWDVKKGTAQTGATVSRGADDLAEVTVTLFLADQDDFDGWPPFLAALNSTVKGATPKALDVYHPDLAENEIGSVVKKGNVGTTHDGMGGQIKVFKLLEYRPPKKASGSPSGSKSNAKKGAAADPNQAALDEIARLTKQYQAL